MNEFIQPNDKAPQPCSWRLPCGICMITGAQCPKMIPENPIYNGGFTNVSFTDSKIGK